MKKQQKKFLLILPLIIIPFLCLVFQTLGGGKDREKSSATRLGLNPELPKANFNPKKPGLDKQSAYEKAGQDSMRRKKYQQQDAVYALPSFKDSTADELQQKLAILQQSLVQSIQPTQPRNSPAMPPAQQYPQPYQEHPHSLPTQHNPVPDTDPQLERLNGMLDKVIRIQHPSEPVAGSPPPTNNNASEVLPADSGSNSISAIVPQKQVLATGATISLRLEDDIRVNKLLIPRGQMVYGLVSINNDRMLIHISSIRNDKNIYTSDLQVYDMDGLPGIHIPGRISRDVTKQSADQGLSGLSLMSYDPSLGAQAANAGIQTAKSLFSRKVRQVRVTVRAGYQLLLRNARVNSSIHTSEFPGEKPGLSPLRPPGFVPGGPFLQQTSSEGLELGVQGIYLQDEKLWFAITVHNGSPITYIPEYTRWFIRDRRVFKSAAVQELTVMPLYTPDWTPIVGDSSSTTWTAFRPFALTEDKELVIEVGEKNGGRVLQLVLHNKHWRTIKKL
jgi:hypothetical protein